MTAPTWRSAGSPVNGTGAVQPLVPATYSANDILILEVEGDPSATLVTPTGWNILGDGTPANTGTSSTGSKLYLFWRRATNDASDQPASFDTGDHTIARIHAFQGCVTSVDPTDFVKFQTATSSTSVTLPDIVCASPDMAVIYCIGTGTSFSGGGNTSLSSSVIANLTKRADDQVTAGVGGCSTLWAGTNATSGTVTGATFTLTRTSAKTGYSVTLAPATVTPAAADTGSAADSATVLIQSTTETGSGLDTAVVSTPNVPGADTGSGLDTATVHATVPGGDTGSGADTALASNTSIVGDTGSGAEAATVRVIDGDAGSSAEQAAGFGADTGTALDAATVRQYGTDTGSGADNAAATNTAVVADTGSGAEASTVKALGADTAAGVDTATVVATVPSADTGGSLENAGQLVTAADTGSFADSAKILIGVADTGTSADSAAPPIAVVFGTETGALADVTGLLLSDIDTGHGVDNARVGVVGTLDSLLRTFTVDADPEASRGGDADGRTCYTDVDPESYRGGDADGRTFFSDADEEVLV